MTSSDPPSRRPAPPASRTPLRGAPAVPNGAPRQSPSHSRFIPREELAGFAAWTPDSLGAAVVGRSGLPPAEPPNAARAAPAAPPPPTREEWLEQVQAARKAGYQDGYRDGLTALDAAKRQSALQISAQVAQLVAAFDDQMQALESRMADAVTATAVTLARQVLRAELATQPDVVAQVAQEAVATLMLSARHIQMRLHPQDEALVAQACAELLHGRHVTLVADAAIERGGCLVESDLGKVDARIDSRWVQAAAVFGRNDPWPEADEGAPA